MASLEEISLRSLKEMVAWAHRRMVPGLSNHRTEGLRISVMLHKLLLGLSGWKGHHLPDKVQSE